MGQDTKGKYLYETTRLSYDHNYERVVSELLTLTLSFITKSHQIFQIYVHSDHMHMGYKTAL